MLRHFTKKGMESRVSKLIIKWCIWLNFMGKGRSFFFGVLTLHDLVLKDIKVQYGTSIPGRTTTE